MPCKTIAEKLNRHYSTIKRFLNRNNLPSNPQKYGIAREDYDNIFKLYNSGLTIHEIHKKFYQNYTADQINYILRAANLTRPNGKKTILNHNYFSGIDSFNKAYWLGLLFADGNVCHLKEKGECYRITLSLMQEDKYLVEHFRDDVESNLQVKEYINPSGFQRKNGEKHIECKLSLHSKQMYFDLKRYGIVENKSLKVNKLPDIKDEFMSHFIRGFFDGNGCATFYKGDTRNLRIMFYSTHDFCECLNKYLFEKIKIHCNKIYDQKKSNVSFIYFARKQDLINLYDFLYKDANIYMKRKKEKFDLTISEYRGK